MVSLNGRAEIAVEGESPSYEENQGEKATQPQTCHVACTENAQ